MNVITIRDNAFHCRLCLLLSTIIIILTILYFFFCIFLDDYNDVEKRYWFDRSFLMDVAVNLDVQVSTGADPRTGTDPNTFNVHTRISPGNTCVYFLLLSLALDD